MLAKVASVVIGRNEGERLRRCLESLRGRVGQVVYVDSGSSDGSVSLALGMGFDVVELDMALPFTAARARNAGFQRAQALAPDHDYVQFVDGDCEIRPDWLERAVAFLDAHPTAAAVCGRRRERYPDRSIYNRLCDIEWDIPAGPAKACGGDAMLRAKTLREVGGYRDDLIAGEEPELCVRLREKGWAIHVLDAEMTLHDAAMTHWRQWWMRNVRAGYAYAEGAHLHGGAPERHRVRELRSALAWGLVIPLAALAALSAVGPWGLALLLVYPIQIVRLFLKGRAQARPQFLRAAFLVIGKFAETQGALRFWALKATRRSARLIEYK